MTLILLSILQNSKFRLKRKHLSYCFLILLAMLITFSASSQVTTDFTTLDSTTACGSLVVKFQDLSKGNPTSWLWDLGNGKIANLE